MIQAIVKVHRNNKVQNKALKLILVDYNAHTIKLYLPLSRERRLPTSVNKL